MKSRIFLSIVQLFFMFQMMAQAGKIFHAFYHPQNIVADTKGNLFVSGKNDKIIRITQDGQVSEFAGNPSGFTGFVDGPGTAARFHETKGIAIDAADNLYVVDYTHIRKITPAGLVSTLVGNDKGVQTDGPFATASFSNPKNIAIDKDQNLYVTDEIFDKQKKASYHTIRKLSRNGQVTTLKNPDGTILKINYAGGLTCDNNGNLIVCDQDSRCIKKISQAGEIATIAGKCDLQKWNPTYKEGPVSSALLVEPCGITTSKNGEVFFSDLRMHRIIKVANGRVTTLAGNGVIDLSHSNIGGYAEEGYADGNARSALFDGPQGIVFDKDGNLFIVDANNSCIRKLSANGKVTTFCK